MLFASDSLGLLEDVSLGATYVISPTLTMIGRESLVVRKEVKDRQVHASARVRKVVTGKWEAEVTAD